MSTREQSRRFHFLREIASGGFGSVYLTKVMHSDGFSRLVAVKLLHRRWSENEEIARRMRDEARLLGWLRHRNIVDVFDLTSIDGRAAVVMEFLEAIDLKQIIQHAAEEGTSIPARPALEIMARVASALDAAYNRPPYPGEKPLRVIHRDIKPSNIMVDEAGTVKVLDFGVARADFDSRESHTRELQFGSVDYMPPERLFFEPETPASDVYSLAATIYEFLVLEKLGKARGRPQKHERFLADRMSYLRAASTSGPMASAVEQLLSECLSYEHSERPPAADVAQRATQLARKIDGPDLREWAEEVLPPHIQGWQGRELAPNPLTDKILNEDRVSLEDKGPVAAASAPAAEEEPEVPRSDPRWEALRQAALDELRPPSIPNPATASPTPAPRRAERPPAPPPPPPPKAAPPAPPPKAAPPAPPAPSLPAPQPSMDFPQAPPPPPAVTPTAPPAFGGASGLEPIGDPSALDDVNAPSLPFHLKQQAMERGFNLGGGAPDPDAATRIGPALPDPPAGAGKLERPPAPSMHMDLDELFGGSPPPPPMGGVSEPPPPAAHAAPPPLPPPDDDATPVHDAEHPPGWEEFDDLDGFEELGDEGFGGAGLGDLEFGSEHVPSSINDFQDEDELDPDEMATRIEPMGDKLDEVLSKISQEEEAPADEAYDPYAPSLDDWGDIPTRLEANPLNKPEPEPQIHEAATMIRPSEPPPPPSPMLPPPGPPSYDAPAKFGPPPVAQGAPPQPMEVWPPPPPPPEPEPEPPRKKKKKSGMLMTVGVAMFAVLTGACLGGVVLIFGEDIRGALLDGGASTAEVEAPSAPALPPEEAAADEAGPVAAPAGPSMHFVSLAPDTRKINVSCTGLDRASGAAEVYIPAASAEKCSVTAILKRGRHTAMVTDATEGEYKCFEGGENKCER